MNQIKHSKIKLISGILQTTSGSIGDLITTKNGVLYFREKKRG